jgi:hypothetical protein
MAFSQHLAGDLRIAGLVGFQKRAVQVGKKQQAAHECEDASVKKYGAGD